MMQVIPNIGMFVGQQKTHIKRGATKFQLQPHLDEEFSDFCDRLIERIAKNHNISVEEAKEIVRIDPLSYKILEPTIYTWPE